VRILRLANPFGFRSIAVGFSLRKLLFDGLMLASLLRQLRRVEYACVHAFEEGALLALLARGGRGLPLIYDMASALPQQLAQLRMFRVPFLQTVFRRIEALVLRQAAVVVCSAGLVDRVRSLAPDAFPHEWRFPPVRRCVSPDEIRALRQELGIASHAPVVVYAGNFAGYQGIDLLLDAAPQVIRSVKETTFVLVGAVNQREIDTCVERLARTRVG
jgi:glycosyltransferase involved in cell wall biosynthesis